MPGTGYIGQFGNPWTSMGGLMEMREMVHRHQMQQNADVRGKQGVGQEQQRIGQAQQRIGQTQQRIDMDQQAQDEAANLRQGALAYDQVGKTYAEILGRTLQVPPAMAGGGPIQRFNPSLSGLF